MFRHLVIVAGLLLLPVAALAQGGNSDSSILPPEQETAPAAPAEKQPEQGHPITPDLSSFPEEIRKGEDEYAAAFNKLTEDQKADQRSLDQGFYVTMVPTMETFDMGGKLIFCFGHKYPGSAISSEQKKYLGYFKAFQAEKELEQQDLWKKQRLAAVRVGYMDHMLMERHYDFVAALQKNVAEQMVDRATRAGVYRDTNCASIQKTLQASADHILNAMKPAPDAQKTAPSGPKKGRSGTPGKPAK